MQTCIDMEPTFNQKEKKWEVAECCVVRGDIVEEHTFNTKREAEAFINGWITCADNHNEKAKGQ